MNLTAENQHMVRQNKAIKPNQACKQPSNQANVIITNLKKSAAFFFSFM